MNHQTLISIDRLLKPVYYVMNRLKWRPSKPTIVNQYIILKFFGIGSITRIAHVMEVINISSDQVTIITLSKNKAAIDLLKLNAYFINSANPLSLVSSTMNAIIKVWRQKNTTILDMERASNLSGIFRLIVSINKCCSSFYFKNSSWRKGPQLFVNLADKSAVVAISEMFEKSYIVPKPRTKNSSASNIVYVNINAGNYLPERKYPRSEFALLIHTLHRKNPQWQFHFSGIQSETDYVLSFKNLLVKKGVPNANLKVMAGTQNLKEFSEALKKAKFFLTCDSGPLHLAHYYGIKTVAIWGPTSAKLVGYKNSTHILNLEPIENCYPCFIHPKSKVAAVCNGSLTCYHHRVTDDIVEKICQFVNI